jgi:hypothetical protein
VRIWFTKASRIFAQGGRLLRRFSWPLVRLDCDSSESTYRRWNRRSTGCYIGSEGELHFYHYDIYAQAIAKIERGHAQDMEDVETMFSRGLVLPDELLRLFQRIEPELYRYPAIDPTALRRRIEAVVRAQT